MPKIIKIVTDENLGKQACKTSLQDPISRQTSRKCCLRLRPHQNFLHPPAAGLHETLGRNIMLCACEGGMVKTGPR